MRKGLPSDSIGYPKDTSPEVAHKVSVFTAFRHLRRETNSDNNGRPAATLDCNFLSILLLTWNWYKMLITLSGCGVTLAPTANASSILQTPIKQKNRQSITMVNHKSCKKKLCAFQGENHDMNTLTDLKTLILADAVPVIPELGLFSIKKNLNQFRDL